MVTTKNRIRWAKIRREAEGYLELGMPEHALDALARLAGSKGVDAHALFLRGEALRSLERYREAIGPLRLAADEVPQNSQVWFALGWCYKRTGRIDLAIDSLQSVLSHAPGDVLAHYNLACYCSLAGEKSRALEFLSRALEIDPDCRQLIDEEPDFDPLRFDPEFQALCAKSEATG